MPLSSPTGIAALIAATSTLTTGERARVAHTIAATLDPDAFTGRGYGMGAGEQARDDALATAHEILDRLARSHA